MTAPDPADSYRLGRRQRVRVVTCRRRQRGTGPGCARARALGHVHRRVESGCITSSPTPTRSGCSGIPGAVGDACRAGVRGRPDRQRACTWTCRFRPQWRVLHPRPAELPVGVRGCGPDGDGSESPTGQTMSTSAVPHRRPRSTYSPHRFLAPRSSLHLLRRSRDDGRTGRCRRRCWTCPGAPVGSRPGDRLPWSWAFGWAREIRHVVASHTGRGGARGRQPEGTLRRDREVHDLILNAQPTPVSTAAPDYRCTSAVTRFRGLTAASALDPRAARRRAPWGRERWAAGQASTTGASCCPESVRQP